MIPLGEALARQIEAECVDLAALIEELEPSHDLAAVLAELGEVGEAAHD